jgi:ribosomal protein S18 acetylase RimI-like enzyme
MVAGITDSAYAKYVALLGRKPQPMTVNYHQVIDEHDMWLLCFQSRPVGVLVLMEQEDHMLIYNVAVSPRYQGKGLGRQLLKWAEEETRRKGYKLIRLYTNALMEANIKLYKRIGYKETERKPYLGSTLVHMSKRLTL